MKFVLAALLFIAMSWAVSARRTKPNRNEESDDGPERQFKEKLANVTRRCEVPDRFKQGVKTFLGKVKECREEDNDLERQGGDGVRGSEAAVETGQSTERQRETRERPLPEQVESILETYCASGDKEEIKTLLQQTVRQIRERFCERNQVRFYFHIQLPTLGACFNIKTAFPDIRIAIIKDDHIL